MDELIHIITKDHLEPCYIGWGWWDGWPKYAKWPTTQRLRRKGWIPSGAVGVVHPPRGELLVLKDYMAETKGSSAGWNMQPLFLLTIIYSFSPEQFNGGKDEAPTCSTALPFITSLDCNALIYGVSLSSLRDSMAVKSTTKTILLPVSEMFAWRAICCQKRHVIRCGWTGNKTWEGKGPWHKGKWTSQQSWHKKTMHSIFMWPMPTTPLFDLKEIINW